MLSSTRVDLQILSRSIVSVKQFIDRYVIELRPAIQLAEPGTAYEVHNEIKSDWTTTPPINIMRFQPDIAYEIIFLIELGQLARL